MLPSVKPGIMFSCGALYHPSCFDDAKKRLEDYGFDIVLVSTHPSLGPNSAGKMLHDDVYALRYQMMPYIAAGREFIVVGHSYGSYPALAATEGWTVTERAAAAMKGGIRAVVFFAATVPTMPGMTPNHIFRAEEKTVYPPIFRHGPVGKPGQLCYKNEITKYALYSDMSPEEADRWDQRLLPHSQDAFESSVVYTVSDAKVAFYYIISEKDLVIPTLVQHKVASKVPGCKIKYIVAGHSAFITAADRFVELLREIAEDICTKDGFQSHCIRVSRLP